MRAVPNHAGERLESGTQKFSIQVRIYYEDTDAGGIAYHASYLRFMERARTDFLRHLGVDQQRLASAFGVQFVVTGLSIKYVKPALLDDQVNVSARITSLGYARVIFGQTVERDGALLATASVAVACLEPGSMKPVLIPNSLREKMKGFL